MALENGLKHSPSYVNLLLAARDAGLKVVPVLLLANMCLGIFFNLSMWYKLTGHTRYGAYFSVFGAVITIVLLIILIPAMGYMGAAWATLICYAAMMVVSYITGQKN